MSKEKDEKKTVKEKDEKTQEKTPDKTDNVSEDPKKVKARYIWVKLRAYVDEAGTQRIDKGLYQTTEVFPRLERAKSGVCEIFEGDVPTLKLVEIAKSFGVSTDNKDLLKTLLTKNINLF